MFMQVCQRREDASYVIRSDVVPAKAGTHKHCAPDLRTTVQHLYPFDYGSPLARGRQ